MADHQRIKSPSIWKRQEMVFLFAGVMFLVLVVGTWGVIRAKRSSEDPSTYYAVFFPILKSILEPLPTPLGARSFWTISTISNKTSRLIHDTEEKGMAPNSPLSLIKLGEEIHGGRPHDHQSGSCVVYEPLRSDFRVVSAIETYQHSKK